VGNEYLGKHEDLKADVHFRQGRMTCVDCHSGHEMHGEASDCNECHENPEASEIAPPDHRLEGLQSPSCESCHSGVTVGNDGILLHEEHSSKLSCQVCHSVSYTNCDGCHVFLSEQTGSPIFATEGSYLGFYIGKNPIQSYARPYEYVPVRHVPISPTSFDYYEAGLVSNISGKETWVYATPHNIQRFTPLTEICEDCSQTDTCANCHGNRDIFLTVDNISPGEINANREVIVDVIPPLTH
jgi:thiosulfate/3-mercaptopyruvate sulfurtransferase